jgi:hypothetical protein
VNNSYSGRQGKPSTSLVSGLYYADSLGPLMKTESNAFVWWDLRNGTDNKGSMDASFHGWRTYGDFGNEQRRGWRMEDGAEALAMLHPPSAVFAAKPAPRRVGQADSRLAWRATFAQVVAGRRWPTVVTWK